MPVPEKGGGKSGTESVITVRRADRLSPDQIDSLCRYGIESMGAAALDEWQLPVIAKWGILLIAEAAGELIGSAQMIRTVSGNDIYMDIFYIRPEYRRRGHGKRLMDAIKEHLGDEGYQRVLATVDPGNQSAMHLYQSAGFCRVKSLENFYGAGRDRLLMAADLGDARGDAE